MLEVRSTKPSYSGTWKVRTWSEKFHQWGEDLNGWDKRWGRAAVREAAQRLGATIERAGEAIRGFVEKAREVIRSRDGRGFER